MDVWGTKDIAPRILNLGTRWEWHGNGRKCNLHRTSWIRGYNSAQNNLMCNSDVEIITLNHI